MRWRSGRLEEEEGLDETSLFSPEEEANAGFVFNHGGATRGNVRFTRLKIRLPCYLPVARQLDKVLPSEYHLFSPFGRSQQTSIELLQVRSFLHCRPAELYLGASTFRQTLGFHLFWDGNVYDAEVVHDWLGELMGTARAYLCSHAT